MQKAMNRNEDDIFKQSIKLRESGDYAGAIDLLGTIENEAGDRMAFLLVIGDLYRIQGDADRALHYFYRAVEKAPAHELASLSLFHLLWEIGEQGKKDASSRAIEEIRRFMSISDSEDYRRIISELRIKLTHP
jgi:tetratricopeptide (TPR) repeat protein